MDIKRDSLRGEMTADERGIFLDMNDDALQLLGYDRKEMIGKPLSIIMPERYRSSHESGFSKYVTTKKSIGLLNKPVEVSALHKQGWEFPAEVHVTVDETPGGKLFFKNMIRDITRQKVLDTASRFHEGDQPLNEPLQMILLEPNIDRQEIIIRSFRRLGVSNKIVIMLKQEEITAFETGSGAHYGRPNVAHIIVNPVDHDWLQGDIDDERVAKGLRSMGLRWMACL